MEVVLFQAFEKDRYSKHMLQFARILKNNLGDINKKNMIITTKKERSSVHTQLFIILFVICWRNYMQWAGRSQKPSTDIFIHW